jgi:hypothetical protein
MQNNKDSIALVAISLVIVAGAISLGLGTIARAMHASRGEFAEAMGTGLIIVGFIFFLLVLFKCQCGGKGE